MLLSHVVNESEQEALDQVLEAENPIEVGFDIADPEPEPEIVERQGKPRCI